MSIAKTALDFLKSLSLALNESAKAFVLLLARKLSIYEQLNCYYLMAFP